MKLSNSKVSSMKKIIAFSLWGNNPKYTIGAIKNAVLAKEHYPGWVTRFYVGSDVDNAILADLKENDAEVVVMPEEGNWTGMFWRFLPASDPGVEVMISRDTDSRLSRRESEAVNEWIQSSKMFHIMRDHPHHNTHILGGMWGVKSPLLRNIDKMINDYSKGNFWQVDQNFLREIIYPIVANTSCVHDDFFEMKKWPSPRNGLEFVGQVFDENEVTVAEHIESLKRHLL